MNNKFDSIRKALSSTDRRKILTGGVAAAGLMAASAAVKPTQAKAQTRARSGDPNTMTLVGVGELLATRRFRQETDPAFLQVVKVMQNADVTYAHAEMNFGTPEELKWTPRGTAGVASYMIADPKVVEDIRWAGVDAISLAHNHSFDWGPEGIFSTIKHVRANGMAYAGTGANLEAARAPVFWETDKGRMSMVSVASGNNQYEWAGLEKGDIPGRPGMNPLRVITRYEVDRESAAQLKAIGKKLGVLSDANAAKPQFNITPGTGVGGTGAASFSFVESDKFDIKSLGHAKDIQGNLSSIQMARALSDFTIVSHHNSTSEGARSENPSEFVVDFARKSIDAGADVYFGHGWHTFLGIEIYKGKPIIYGMGNFILQSGFLERVPADSYESWNFDMAKLTTLSPASGNLHPGEGQEDWCWSAIYELNYRNGRLAEIVLHPVDMGMDFSSGKGVMNRYSGQGEHKLIEGLPHIATGANGQEILRRLQQRCRLRGTTMTIRGGVGVVTV